MFDKFIQKIKQSYDRAFLLHPVRKFKRLRKPWVTCKMYNGINESNKLYNKFIPQNYQTILTEYKKKRNKLNADLKKARIKYYRIKVIAVSNDAR